VDPGPPGNNRKHTNQPDEGEMVTGRSSSLGLTLTLFGCKDSELAGLCPRLICQGVDTPTGASEQSTGASCGCPGSIHAAVSSSPQLGPRK
jgi:hypothetical protein